MRIWQRVIGGLQHVENNGTVWCIIAGKSGTSFYVTRDGKTLLRRGGNRFPFRTEDIAMAEAASLMASGRAYFANWGKKSDA